MGLFKRNKDKEKDNQTKCEKCGTELHDPERSCKETRSEFKRWRYVVV